MQAKYNSFIKNATKKLISMSENQQAIIKQQYFKLKKDQNSKILKYKAKLIAHNFNQEESNNFVLTFIAIMKFMSYKYLFRISIKRGHKI